MQDSVQNHEMLRYLLHLRTKETRDKKDKISVPVKVYYLTMYATDAKRQVNIIRMIAHQSTRNVCAAILKDILSQVVTRNLKEQGMPMP